MLDLSLEAIRKKLIGQKLTYPEACSIMEDIAHDRLNQVQTTYFVASNYAKGVSDDELYNLTKAMSSCGKKISFSGIVANKHSIGGVGGTRITMILVPIIAALGIKIPKTSSRAITSPAGTADVMEVLAPVTFSADKIKELVNKVGGCIVWGGGSNIAPADDKIIKVERQLNFESFDQLVISIIGKQVAVGSTHVLFDIPLGVKINKKEHAEIIRDKAEDLSKKFGIKIEVLISKLLEPSGSGLGSVLSARDVLRVLQQKDNRSHELEKRSLMLTGELLELCGKAKNGEGCLLAEETLRNKAAWRKMQQIILAQGGRVVDSEDLVLADYSMDFASPKSGKIEGLDNEQLNKLCFLLGAPNEKKAGVYLYKKIGESIKKEEPILRVYTQNKEIMALAQRAFPISKIYNIR